MNKTIGVILIAISLVLGYLGVDKLLNSNRSVEIVGIQIEAKDSAGEQQGYLFTGLAIIVFAGGVYILSKK